MSDDQTQNDLTEEFPELMEDVEEAYEEIEHFGEGDVRPKAPTEEKTEQKPESAPEIPQIEETPEPEQHEERPVDAGQLTVITAEETPEGEPKTELPPLPPEE
jgi:hypothetical protein